MGFENSSTLESQSQNHSQKLHMMSPKTLTYGVSDWDFGFDSQEWICSENGLTMPIGCVSFGVWYVSERLS